MLVVKVGCVVMTRSTFLHFFNDENILVTTQHPYRSNYSAPPMGMSNRLTVVLQQELH